QLFDCLEQIRYLPLAATPLIEQSLQSSRLTLRVAAIQCLKAHDTSLVETELLHLLLERFQDPYEAPAVLSAATSLLSSFPNEDMGALAKQLAGLPEPSLSNTMWALADSSPGSPLSLETVKSLIEKPQLSLSARCGATLALRGMSDSNESMMRLLSQLQGNQDEASLRACQILVLSQSRTADPALAEQSAAENSLLIRACKAYSDAMLGNPGGAEALIPLLVASPHRLDANPGSDSPDYAANELARALLLELGNDAILPLQSVIARQELPPALRAQALEVLLAIPQDDYGYLLGWIGDPVVGQICEQSFLQKTPMKDDVLGLRLLFQLHRACDAPSLRYRYQKLAEQVVATFSTGNEAATPDRRSSSLVRLLHAKMSGDTFLRPVNADLLAGSNFELLDTSDSGRFHSAVHPFDIPVASASEATSFEAVDTLTATPQFAAQMQSFGALPRGAQPPSAIGQAATEVNVFYGTNRRMNWDVLPHLPSVSRVGFSIMWPLSLGTLVAAALWMFLRSGRSTFLPLSMAAVAGLLAMTAAFRVNDTAVRRLGQPAAYAGEFADGISFGICRVSIPPKHLPGELEGPSIFRLEIREDDQEHIVLKSTTELESRDFFRELDTEMLSKGRNLLVFIHGYNVSFEDAARRTAQLVHDLEFPGAPVCYSWPSQSSWYQYRQDQENIRRSVPHIKQFLLQLAQRTRADSIHLIAHSMGSVGLTEALADMSPTPSPRFQQVVLAAPDINAESFRTEIVPKITGKAKRFTMYVSSSDLALLASRYFNAGWRVGELLNLHDIPFIDVIDSSAVDTSLLGHSYYGQLSVLSDLAELLMDQPLEERTNIQKRVHNGVAQTVFRIPRIASAEDQQAVSR
ncbi:MAG: alpha/beta hydrolase, partial [bacterium]|nr:alpha/beta hydrolase [bacterium]